MVEIKAFLPNQGINILYPNMENMIVVPITKTMEIIRRIQVCLIQQMKLETKKNGAKKALATKPKHQYRVSP